MKDIFGDIAGEDTWLSEDERRVAEDTVDEFWVSTVRLHLDHQWGDGPPLWYETMVFPVVDGEVTFAEQYCERYSTATEAKIGHDKVVALIKEGKLPSENFLDDEEE